MTDADRKALKRFWQAVEDPDPSSMDVAEDIALEHGWKLWKLGEEQAALDMDMETISKHGSVGSFWYKGESRSANGVTWYVTETLPTRSYASGYFTIQMVFSMENIVWNTNHVSAYVTRTAARDEAVRDAWSSLATMKTLLANGDAPTDVRDAIMGGRMVRSVHAQELNPVRTVTDAKAAFWSAVRDPDPASQAVAVDIALENGWKLWQLAEEYADARGVWWGTRSKDIGYGSYGGFWFDANDQREQNGCEWRIHRNLSKRFEQYEIEMFFTFTAYDPQPPVTRPSQQSQWTWESSGIYPTIYEARRAAARYAWWALKIMKSGYEDATDANRVMGVIKDRQLDELPPEVNPSVGNDDVEARRRFWDAMRDPSENSTEVAQDIALEHGWKLWQLGEMVSSGMWNELQIAWHFESNSRGSATTSRGAFVLNRKVYVEWVVDSPIENSNSYAVTRFIRYEESSWVTRLRSFSDVVAARNHAARYAWNAFADLKHAYRNRWSGDEALTWMNRNVTDPVPDEIVNPSRNPDDLAAARDKYKEFHRYDPKSEGSFPSSFKIPERMLHAGKAKWVTYRSSKVDPSTLRKPRAPVDYIHEHDAGVETYLADSHPDTTVPEKFRDVGALVKLGECLGFCVIDADGDQVEAEGRSPLPELYSTPDGKCLFVIQSKKTVLAMTWGGALGVFARGIDG